MDTEMMAPTVPLVHDLCMKDLTKSSDLRTIPSQFTFVNDSKGSISDSLPIVDFSLLVSDNPDQRSKALLDLGKACEEWGFFVLINHGIPETLMKAIIKASSEFFNLPEEEKRRYEAKSASDPIKAGIGTANGANHKPDQAIGIPPHSDPGLLTFLIHNGVSGLQIEHNGEWFRTNSPQNSILVNTADHLEIFSNGRYKSVKHRAVVNTETTRISVVVANGPAPDVIVSPSVELAQRDGRALYGSMKFIEYVETQLSNRYDGKSNLDCLKIQGDQE